MSETAYPKIGSILVNRCGTALVHVWPNESQSRRCFTGVSLLDGDCSCLWLLSAFEPENIFKRGLISTYRMARKRVRRGQ